MMVSNEHETTTTSEQTAVTTYNLLITGGSGFIASNFLLNVINTYPHYKFVNLDRLDYCSNSSTVPLSYDSNSETYDSNSEGYDSNAYNDDSSVATRSNYTFVKGDITDAELVSKLLVEHNINVVMHFAAQSHVDRSFTDQLSYIDTNIVGTYTLLECCRKYMAAGHNISKFIHVSTDEVYGDSELVKDETAPLLPTNPYSASKAAAEMICHAYYKSFKIPLIITRGNNVYGPWQYHEKVVPRFIRLLQNGGKCTIHGSGNYYRSFLHVDDVVAAFNVILHKGVIGNIYNIGTDVEISILQVAQLCVGYLKGLSANVDDYLIFVADRVYNDKSYPVNSEKLKKLGWAPAISFETGLKSTIDWYLTHDDSYWLSGSASDSNDSGNSNSTSLTG